MRAVKCRTGPSFTGYSQPLAEYLSAVDGLSFTNLQNQIPAQDTIPYGNFPAFTNGRLVEAYISAQVIGHDISFGKQDEWMGPAVGGGMAYSNNAENIYSFRSQSYRTASCTRPFAALWPLPL